jgi:LysM repeat protein
VGADRSAHYHAVPVARIFAVSALAIAAIVVIVVVSSSLGGSDESAKSREHANGPNTQKEHHDKYYVVQPGDTFAGIADKEGFTVQRLEKLNPNLDTQLLPEQGCINLVPDGCKILANGG